MTLIGTHYGFGKHTGDLSDYNKMMAFKVGCLLSTFDCNANIDNVVLVARRNHLLFSCRRRKNCHLFVPVTGCVPKGVQVDNLHHHVDRNHLQLLLPPRRGTSMSTSVILLGQECAWWTLQ
jgi:hypothetical protein